ncbi:hypothetical protein BGZ75_009584, partial [Mortierella antarctica]
MTTNVADAKRDRRDLGAIPPEVVNVAAEPNELWKHYGHNKHGHGQKHGHGHGHIHHHGPNCHHNYGHGYGHGHGHGHHHHGKCKTKTVVAWAPCTTPPDILVQPITNPTTANPGRVTTNPTTANPGRITINPLVTSKIAVPASATTATSEASTGAATGP